MENQTAIDLLNRTEFVESVMKIINTLSQGKKNASFAINGKWGVGKSYILDRLEEQLNYKEGYLVFRYNAWENDFYEEPLIAIISSFAEQLNDLNVVKNAVKAGLKEVVSGVKNAFLGLIGKVTKAKLGFDAVETIKNIRKAKEIEEIDTKFNENLTINSVKKEVRENLVKLSEKVTIVVMVDELDRCLPEYAIKTLERLHHLFYEIPNLQVIIATDKEQLENTVHTIFGMTTNTKNYLKKFIDFEISLNEGEINDQFKAKYKEYCDMFVCKLKITREEDVEEFYAKIFDGIDARTQSLIVQKAHTIHVMIRDSSEVYDYAHQCIGLTLTTAMHLHSMDDIAEQKEISSITETFIWNNKHFEFIKEKMCVMPTVSYGSDISPRYIIGVNLVWDIIGVSIFKLCQYNPYAKSIDWSWSSTNAFNISQQTLNEFAEYTKTFMDWLRIID